MRRWIRSLTCLLILTAAPALALNSGDDVLVPAAGRGAPWVTDLFIMNPGSSTISVTVSWLVRGQPNPSPTSIQLTLLPGETAVLDDVIFNDFGLASGNGAFRIQATGPVIANCRIYATDGGATFGQGFEGVPAWAFTQQDQSAETVGLTQGFGFRTNVYAIAGRDGATISFSLRDPSGTELGTATLVLGPYEPYLRRITSLFSGLANFQDGTLRATVTAGSANVGASKVDNASTDPTTLESSQQSGGPLDGTYYFIIEESTGFASGGWVEIEDGTVTSLTGSYSNYDKSTISPPDPDCIVVFLFEYFIPTPLEDFHPDAGGVTFSEEYTDSGEMTWTLQFEIEGNQMVFGDIDASGSDFPSDPDPLLDESGCNGDFPTLSIRGGKDN